MSAILDQADHLVALLRGAGIAATADPAVANTNRPCVLVPPPALDVTDASMTWRLAALSSHDAGTYAALVQLAGLVDLVADVLHVEAADPASYALTSTGTVPAYLLTITTSF